MDGGNRKKGRKHWESLIDKKYLIQNCIISYASKKNERQNQLPILPLTVTLLTFYLSGNFQKAVFKMRGGDPSLDSKT